VSKNQLGFVMGDNASNISKAFNVEDLIIDDWVIHPHTNKDHGVGLSDPISDEEEREMDLMEPTENQEQEQIIMTRDFQAMDFELDSVGAKRLRCLAHTIQLAINDSLKSDETVSDLVQYLNTIIKVFRKSPLRSDDLSNKIKRQLIPIGQTRWNSILFAAERMIEVCQF